MVMAWNIIVTFVDGEFWRASKSGEVFKLAEIMYGGHPCREETI